MIAAAENVKKKLSSESAIGDLGSALKAYMDGVKPLQMSGTVTATPKTGNAPFTTTLSASASDPSGITIQASNYLWFLKTPGGGRQIIGTGPTISHTFQEEKAYTVFVEVNSSSRNSKGKTDVLPYIGSVEINVMARIVNLYLTINGSNVTNLSSYKVSPAVARAGLLIDATASRPATGTQFVSTLWKFGNTNESAYDGGPRLERQIYANQGTYSLRLEMRTNK